MPQDVNIDTLKATYKFYKEYKEYRKLTSTTPTEKDVRERALEELEGKNPYFSRHVYSGIVNV